MSQTQNSNAPQRKLSSPRRLVLLASAASLGVAVLLAGPGYAPVITQATTGSAQAAESIHAQQPASFADLVAKVKPAVISVRVKLDNSAEVTPNNHGMQQFQQGQPFQKFFRRFGFENGPGNA